MTMTTTTTMNSNNAKRRWTKLVVSIVGACAIVAFLDDDRRILSSLVESSSSSSSSWGSSAADNNDNERPPSLSSPLEVHLRRLQVAVDEDEEQAEIDEAEEIEEEYAPSDVAVVVVSGGGGDGDGDAVYPWARDHLHPLTETPSSNPRDENYLFWHIPKSGGSTAKALYHCFGQTVDVLSQPAKIIEAKDLGVVESGQVDVIFSSYPSTAIAHLFDDDEKRGRALAMFRHPVERLFSKFFYLQIATWEKTYRPEWKNIDVYDWVKKGYNMDNDHMVKKLAGKVQRDPATEDDLRAAMDTLRERFVVGLMDEMRESVRRFNVVMGVNENDTRNRRCLKTFFGEGGQKKNSNPHAKVPEDSPAWQLLAEKNSLDIRLYEYVLQLFEEQKELVDSYATRRSDPAPSSSEATAEVSRRRGRGRRGRA